MTDEPKTVRVRVAVVVDEEGAYGVDRAPPWGSDAVAFKNARHNLMAFADKPVSEHIITAEVPLPAPPAEIPGEVEGAT